MFALIPLVIAIILSGLVATSMIYNGGNLFTESKANAKAQIFVNEGAQIQSAIRDYQKVFGVYPPSVNTLLSASPPFLRVGPKYSYTIDANGRVISRDPEITKTVCAAVQEAAGQSRAPAASLSASQMFGCYDNAGYEFYFQ